MNRREHAEEEVRKKVAAFEEKLNDYNKEVESFKKKEVWSWEWIGVYFSCPAIGHVSMALANERRRYMRNVFSHWLRPFSHDVG